MKESIYTRITREIVADLEHGVAPWVRPWGGTASALPHNAATGHCYRGINHLLLGMRCYAQGFASNGWITFRQATKLGGSVRRGERGTSVVYYQPIDPKADDEGCGGFGSKPRAVLRVFTVFNLDQVKGLEALIPDVSGDIPWAPYEAADNVIEQSGADIRHQGGAAFYSPTIDRIVLPMRSAFGTADGYYATALHELSHWTGHPSRLNRQMSGRFGSEDYAFEELVAEISSAFLCAHCAIQGQLQHSSYIASWIKALNDDHRAIFRAASQAQHAADYLLGTAPAAQSLAA
jgi:antirestriction protein ArdC